LYFDPNNPNEIADKVFSLNNSILIGFIIWVGLNESDCILIFWTLGTLTLKKS
jgi:hypothetical protein